MEFNIGDIWTSMSIPVKGTLIFMLLMSVFSLYVVIERYITFRQGQTQSMSYVLALRDYLAKRKIDDALRAAQLHGKSPVARVVENGLKALKQGKEALHTEGPDDVGDFDLVDSVNRALERVKERETSNLRKGLAYLGTVASATPFIGLLGTVVGILGTFQLLKGGSVTINEIGPKISEALVSTALGLGVAIIGAMSFNFFTSRVEQFVIDMNDVSSEFIDYVLREGRG
jgi:biopolymer transport protein ExbB/TolQ